MFQLWKLTVFELKYLSEGYFQCILSRYTCIITQSDHCPVSVTQSNNMGISIDQYRARIGNWCCNQGLPSYNAPLGRDQANVGSAGDTVIKYSWKVCTMLLCLTIIGTTVIHLPSPLASTLPVATGSCTSAGITDQPPVQQNLISHQCAQALLIIGGVEQNPGPAQLSTEQQLQDLDGILARLSSNAPSNDVRDTMRLYDPRLDQKALERQINKASKSALVACLAYLGRSDMNEFTKDACVTAMICRIQNLLPDQCNLCKKQYCINTTDTPLLSCAVCGVIVDKVHMTNAYQSSYTWPNWSVARLRQLTHGVVSTQLNCQDCITCVWNALRTPSLQKRPVS